MSTSFVNPEVDPLVEPTTPPPEPVAPPAAPSFLIDEEDLRYRDKSDVVAGLREKNRYIEQLRSELATRTAAPAAPAAAPAPSTRFYKALENMVQAKADEPLTAVLDDYIGQMVQARLSESLSAVTPLLSHAGLEYAAQVAATAPNGDPNIPAFVKSPAFQKALTDFPVLKQGVEAFQTDGASAREQLPQLLAIAYRMYGQPPAAAPAAPAPSARTVPTVTAPAPTVPTQTTVGDRWADNDPRWNMDLREVFGR